MTLERIKLTQDQVHALSEASDWMQLTEQQHQLVKTCGAGRACAFIGDELVRMPIEQFRRMLEAGFKAATYSAIAKLGISQASEIADINMQEYEFGRTHLSVTVTAVDGRAANALGELVLPATPH